MQRAAPAIALLLLAGMACQAIPEEPELDSFLAEPVVPLATASRIDLGTLGGMSSFATDVNELGTVVGWSETGGGGTRAFRWTITHGMTDLGTLPGDDWSRAISVANTGQVFGFSGRAGDSNGSPVLWTGSGTATPLSIPLTDSARVLMPLDGNEWGQVTGWTAGFRPSHAWVWSPRAGFYDITAHLPDFIATGFGESYGSDINAFGVVVGTNHARVCVHVAECWHAFVWNALTGYRDIGIPIGDDLRVTQVTGSAINDVGMVVGWTSDHGAFPPTEPYVWTERRGFTVLPNFLEAGNPGGYAEDVNLLGTVVGGSAEGEFDVFQAAAWPKAGGIVRLSADNPNPSIAMAVNASGVVVGWSSLDCCGFTGNHATLWKLGPGRGVAPAPARSPVASRSAVAKRAWSETAQHGPVACLSNRAAMLSRASFVDCFARSGE